MKNHKNVCNCSFYKQERGEFITEEVKENMSKSHQKRHSCIWKGNMKKCPKCGKYKPFSEYYKNYTNSHNSKGLYTYCIECTKKKNKKRKRKMTHSIRETYGIYKRNAKKRGFDFNLTYNDIGTLMYSDCYYCGGFPSEINGIDRVDSSKGYNVNNVVPCCSKCNYLKNSSTQEEFALWIVNVYDWAIDYLNKERGFT